MNSYRAGLLVLLVAFVVTACGGSRAQPQESRPTEQPAITEQPAGFNAADQVFAKDMVTLNRQTGELTTLASSRSTNPNLIALAAEISARQAPDLQTVKALLAQWNSNSDNGSGEGGSSDTAKGTVDDATVARLGSLSGPEFDALWLRSMIGHQQGGVDVAEAEVANGANVDALATARQIVATYQAQIAQMQRVLANN